MHSQRFALISAGVLLLTCAAYPLADAQAGPGPRLSPFAGHTHASPLLPDDDGFVRELREAGPADGDGPPLPDLVEEWLYDIGAAVLSSPRLADLDGDGVEDVIVSTYDPVDPYSAGRVYAIDIEGNVLSGWPVTTHGPCPTSPAVADIDNDGDMEVVAGSWYHAYVWNHDGTDYAGWPNSIGTSKSPAVQDLDDDGDLEIVYPASNKRLYVWHHDGTALTGWPYIAPENVGSPAVADVDGDGELELVAGTYEGPVGPDPFEVYVWNLDGSVAGGFPVATSGVVKAAVSLGDVDNDSQVEIVATAYHTSNSDYLYVWDAAGNLEPGWPVRAPYTRLSAPALGDLDRDGDLEILIGGLYPDTFDEQLFAFHHDGAAVTGWPVILDHPGYSGNINSSPVIADIDGDSSQMEVVVKVVDHFFALHSDGTVVDGFPYLLSDESHTGTFSPSPAVGDLDGDRDVEYVFVSCNGAVAFFDEPHAFSEHYAFWPMFQHDRYNTAYLAPALLGDLDHDGDVDLADLAALLTNYGNTSGMTYEDGDIDGDGDVDLADLGTLLSNYGT